MKSNSTFEIADNGIILRYDDNYVEIMEHGQKLKNTFLKQTDLTVEQKTIGLIYGGVVANTINCFDTEILQKAKGFRVKLEITPIFETKDLYKYIKK